MKYEFFALSSPVLTHFRRSGDIYLYYTGKSVLFQAKKSGIFPGNFLPTGRKSPGKNKKTTGNCINFRLFTKKSASLNKNGINMRSICV